ncbi:hypothetical protein CYMTET_10972 [Cymbomonas tetramitiformis]|uniref:Pirin n=1 Tax=Cymbomonas tetramitiformis TaxID=36881 RepID=A0AAE0LDX4_9CHLO|nr:hypothetical protein CYMTET_10972 [Cymbomonas tetramitiformis]
MEIITYIVEGELTHQDSMGTSETLGSGSVQFMSAGTGVRHSEHNLNHSKPLRFIQMWITPRARGGKPNYGSAHGEKNGRQNTWQHLVTDVKSTSASSPVKLNQDVNLFVTEISDGAGLDFRLNAGRQAYLLCMEGSVQVTGSQVQDVLGQHEAAEIVGANQLKLVPTSEVAHCLMVEMQSV